MVEEDISKLLCLAKGIEEHIIDIRRDIHAHPELSGNEYRTADIVKRELNKLGIPYTDWPDYPGVVGLIKGAYDGPVIALRADMDALPIHETRTELPFVSKNEGIMHACGHDVHTAVLLGAAAVLKKLAPSLHGSVKLIFQPSEEGTPPGARCMIARGCMEDPHADRVFALHVDPALKCGKVSCMAGIINAASDNYRFTVKGVSSHGTKPQDGVDAIYAACQMINALYSIPVRRVSALESVSLNVGTISGGTADNIIAENAKFGLCLRTVDDRVREFMLAEIPRVVNAAATLYNVEIDTNYWPGLLSQKNDGECVDALRKVVSSLYGDIYVAGQKPVMSSEDFSEYCAYGVPGAMWYLGVGNDERGLTAPLHNSNFCPDERAISIGVAIQSGVAYALLGRKG